MLTVDQFVLNDNFFSGVVTVPVGMIVNRFVVERVIERFSLTRHQDLIVGWVHCHALNGV